MTKRAEAFTAVLLATTLLISVCNEFISGKSSNNLQRQVNQDLALSKAYGETSAMWLEVNEMLQRNLSAAFQGILNKSIEESGKFSRESFIKHDWEYWRKKTVMEFWKHSYDEAWTALRKSLDTTNGLRREQKNYILLNEKWEKIEGLLRLLQVALILLVLWMYRKSIQLQKARNK